MRCAIFLSVLTFLLRSNALAIGTYVSESMNAPIMAKNIVIAMGRNIFPSMPARVMRGMYTIIIIISPNAAEWRIFDAE